MTKKRVMLGSADGVPQILVETNEILRFAGGVHFEFYVLNGDWYGSYNNGDITVYAYPDNGFKATILEEDTPRLYSKYGSSFARSDLLQPDLVVIGTYQDDGFDDDIPF